MASDQGPRPRFARVAIASPLRRLFDYRIPDGPDYAGLGPGMRVRVPFGRTTRIGMVMALANATTVPAERLRPITARVDSQPCLDPGMLELLQWVADYYHHPPGEVIDTALPKLLRGGAPLRRQETAAWRLSAAGRNLAGNALARAPRQAELHALLAAADAVGEDRLHAQLPGWRAPLRALLAKGLVEACRAEPPAGTPTGGSVRLSAGQRDAVARIGAAAGGFQAFLLDGVTGSGKTEVYLRAIETVIAAGGRQALVLLPEIGLTPQIIARFRERLGARLGVMHSGLTDRERLDTWVGAAEGAISVVVGTRSAIFVPLARPGIVIVDEEHDLSYKQQDGLRYSARDLALKRAQLQRIPVVLGSATPALESLENARAGRYHELRLPTRVAERASPLLRIIDIRNLKLAQGMSQPLLSMIAATLAAGRQVLIFLNRRGYAPVLMCHHCGWHSRCRRCDANMTWHRRSQRLRCHHCGAECAEPQACPACGESGLQPVGRGTERVEEALQSAFPAARIRRIDRDSTRRKGAMQAGLDAIHQGDVDILVGTQMLAKGHHFPNVTLVAVLDADGGLFSCDFRAAERMAQLLVQVAGRAGRGEHPGTVLIQTHNPDHPLLGTLLQHGYRGFAAAALQERRATGLPPFSHLALLRAEAVSEQAPLEFLGMAAQLATHTGADEVEILGPVPAPMERRAGRFRAQLLLRCPRRGPLHRFLDAWLPQIEEAPLGRRVRWSLDVDPQDMY